MEVCFQGGGGEKVAEGDLIQHFVNPSSKSNRSLTKPSGFVFTIFCGVGSSERRQKVISQPLVLNKVTTTTPLWKNDDEDGDMLGIVTDDNVIATDVHHDIVDGVGKIISRLGGNIDGQEVDEEDRSPLPG